jgi:hypothetical protein
MKKATLVAKVTLIAILTMAATATLCAKQAAPSTITGDYLEVRSCDVYTGPCFANAEMGLSGKEGILVWSVRQGTWKGTTLDGLKVIAVVRTEATLGDQRYQPRNGKAVLIIDNNATSQQRDALIDLARTQARSLLKEVAEVKTASMDVSLGTCSSGSCATVKAAGLVEISTRCIGGKDHLCGNEEKYYPPLTDVQNAFAAFTEVASYTGSGLNATWQLTGQRSAYLGTFAM